MEVTDAHPKPAVGLPRVSPRGRIIRDCQDDVRYAESNRFPSIPPIAPGPDMNRTSWLYSVLVAIAMIPMRALAGDDFPAPAQHRAVRVACPSRGRGRGRLPRPEGFRVSVFAAEPDVQNPIAMAWDRRGRLWIAENYTYAERPGAVRPPPCAIAS